MSHSVGAAELSAALSAHVDGSFGVCSHWVSGFGRPRSEDLIVVCKQSAIGFPLRLHSACAGKVLMQVSALPPSRQQGASALHA